MFSSERATFVSRVSVVGKFTRSSDRVSRHGNFCETRFLNTFGSILRHVVTREKKNSVRESRITRDSTATQRLEKTKRMNESEHEFTVFAEYHLDSSRLLVATKREANDSLAFVR